MISELQQSNSRQQKGFNLALPQMKTWLVMAMQHSRTMYQYQSRAVTLLDEIMNPGVDFTLVRVSDADDDASIQDRFCAIPWMQGPRPLVDRCWGRRLGLRISRVAQPNGSITPG
ncbi:hypothetical protein V5799_027204 [Amblyomma americanum]|uniref:Uncharacterized protein n=1 Tax=Amblyomma americanum TaxID=6943 RepID=A0AAQ4DGE3_AMBAM